MMIESQGNVLWNIRVSESGKSITRTDKGTLCLALYTVP